LRKWRRAKKSEFVKLKGFGIGEETDCVENNQNGSIWQVQWPIAKLFKKSNYDNFYEFFNDHFFKIKIYVSVLKCLRLSGDEVTLKLKRGASQLLFIFFCHSIQIFVLRRPAGEGWRAEVPGVAGLQHRRPASAAGEGAPQGQ